jgi:transmembrane sensor
MTPEPASGMTPRDAAAFWLARHDADPSTAADPAFLAWLTESEDNAATWARAQAMWTRAAQDLRDDPLAQALRASALAARPPLLSQEAWPRVLAAACVAVAVLLGAGVGWRYWDGRQAASPQVATATPAIQLATLTGERRAVTLADGTRLDMDSATRVDVAFDHEARRLRVVSGQVYIQVAHDAARPFTVDARDQTIVDRGTEFGVRVMPGMMSVTLAQGSVAVGAHGGPAVHELKPGERLMLRDGRPAQLQAVDVNAVLAWREGFVEFSDTPLSDAVAEMNRHGGRKLVIADPAVGALKVSGRFKLGEPERFLRTVSMLLPVRAVRVGETLEIRAAPPSEPAR